MNNKYRFLITMMLFMVSFSVDAQKKEMTQADSIEMSIKNIDYYLKRYEEWYPQDYDMARKMRSLVNYVQDHKIDLVLKDLEDYQLNGDRYFFRTVENVSDSLSAPGYINYKVVKEEQAKIDRNVRNSINVNDIKVPQNLIEQAQLNVPLLTPNEASKLLEMNYITLPDTLLSIQEQMAQQRISRAELATLQRRDSIRTAILESARQQYNTEKLKYVEDSVSWEYREQVVRNYSIGEQNKYAANIAKQNKQALDLYNEEAMRQANQIIDASLYTLLNYVNNEQLSLWVYNSVEDSTEILLSNSQPFTYRFFIKNEQQDSLGVRAFSKDRNSLMMFIDDGVTLNRFKERKHKEADFGKVNLDDRLTAIGQKYEIVTPWMYGASFNAGLNQTYLKNWVKGGETSLAGLFTFKGYANYKLDKVTWSNTLDMRNGWISTSDGGFEKNEDKLELISNFGLQAVKKWYYTAQVDLETQMFNSYKYPDRENPKSGFLAPLKSLFKLGMDYKDGDLSLFMSPMTMKCVSVRDTSIYDQTLFGIEKNAESYWDLGFNVDVKYTQPIMDNFSLQTKYKMFLDYQNMFSSYDIDWENTFNFKVNDFLRAQVILHLLYDDNVTFDTGRVDANGKAIYKAKWQFKEFFSLGFTYKLDREVKRRRKIIN